MASNSMGLCPSPEIGEMRRLRNGTLAATAGAEGRYNSAASETCAEAGCYNSEASEPHR
jgi:hypothetical protein